MSAATTRRPPDNRPPVFVQEFATIDCPYEAVARRVEGHIEQVLGVAIDETQGEGERLIRKVAPASWPATLAKTVALRVGPIRRTGNRLLVALSWETPGTNSLFPRFEADLEITPLGTSETSLALRGRYDPPAGAIGRRVDELLLHHLATATVRAFLDSVAASLDDPTTSSGDGHRAWPEGSAP